VIVDEPIPWVTFAPLEPHWVIPPTVSLPYQFSEAVSICSLPSWIQEDDPADGLRPQLRDKIDTSEPTCIQIQYQASALSSEQRDATRQIFSLHLALWLARGTPLSFDVIAHAENYGSQWVTRHIVSYNSARPLPAYQGESLTVPDFDKAKMLFHGIENVSSDGTVRTALGVTTRALVEGSWELRYLLFWLALEALFGPDDGREITFQLAQRIALFLEPDGTKAQQLCRDVKKSYGWRSKMVHGRKLTTLKDEEDEELIKDLEILARRALVAVLEDEKMVSIFDGGNREKFLDSLAFR
jgi:hypothetical protein